MNLKLIFLTTLTMVAFAANSILCRLALVDSANDPLSFTLIRLLSGAFILSFIFIRSQRFEPLRLNKITFLAPAALFSYALFFSLSYVQIDAGTGALILFACVQLTMMLAAFLSGQKMNSREKIGVFLAVTGFVYLLLPGMNMPSPIATALMTLSGVSWGLYSLLGKSATNPVYTTARNFVLTVPVAILLILIFPFNLTDRGLLLAAISGAITSGMSYVLWYVVLKDLVTSTAAIVQLSVPALAAFGGVLFLSESIQIRLAVASAVIFIGIYIKVKSPKNIN